MDRFYDGIMVDVRMWEVARTQDEIQANMNSYLNGSETGLIAYWRMNEGSGQTVFDFSGSGYDLQLGSAPNSDTNDPAWLLTNCPYEVTLTADFSADVTLGNFPLAVNFTDSSAGIITNWLWNFGDGDTSAVQNPEHTYQTADSFTVSLNVTGPDSSDTIIKENYIIVTDPTGLSDNYSVTPKKIYLYNNYPNPFNPTTKINYDLSKNVHVKITVFDIQGKMIHTLVDGYRTAGSHSVDFNGNGLASGLYYYRLQTSQGFV